MTCADCEDFTNPKIRINEIKPIDLEGGYVIDGFPSVGLTSAIASESMMQSSQYELAGYVDSDFFQPISIIKNGMPYHPTNIFVNDKLKVGVFTSHLSLHESLHREAAKMILSWAKKHKCSLIVSSIAIKSPTNQDNQIIGAASTQSAKEKLVNANIPVLYNGTIPGIPGLLLSEGRFTNQNVVVLVFNPEKEELPDFRSGARLCLEMSKLIPGTSCDIRSLEKQAEIVERNIQETKIETKNLNETMYR